jgi:predicted aminopeptidase
MIKKRFFSMRPSLRLLALAAIAFLLPSCYVLTVGTKYLSYQAKARPVDILLKDDMLDAGTRAFLERSKAVRAFAVGKLGLKESKNYTTLADSGRGYIADVVQACAPDAFKRYLWSYPVVGKLPYKGFFDRPSAEKEAARLKAKGYDVLTREVDGFSTLGFLKDPLWTFMVSYSDADLSDLIIHELSHATIYRQGQQDFNEEVATFIGERGSLEYLTFAHGDPSSQLEAEKARRRSSDAFVAFMRETAAELEVVYARGLPREEVLARKTEMLAARARLYAEKAPELFEDPAYRSFDFSRVNNAYLDLYRLYWGDSALYARYCEKICSGSLPAFILRMKALAKSEKDPKAAMRAELDRVDAAR